MVLDNDYSTWTAYQNRFWPRKYLIDIDGFIVYDHIGEGGYEEIEAKIVELLNERADRFGDGDVEIASGTPKVAEEVDFKNKNAGSVFSVLHACSILQIARQTDAKTACVILCRRVTRH